MTFLPECFSLFKWMHNDSMSVRFVGMRNTKTWSKSRECVEGEHNVLSKRPRTISRLPE